MIIREPIDEGGVGPVLQKPPYEIGEQVPVPSHRCIDTAGLGERFRMRDLAVQGLSHAVKPLELVRTISGDRRDGGNGVRVVRSELRIEAVGLGEQRTRSSKIGHVRVYLAG